MLDVENLQSELYALMGSKLATGLIILAAGGPGNFSRTALNNPAGSGVLIRIQQIFVRSTTGMPGTLGISTDTHTTAGTQANLDSRFRAEGTVGQISGQADAAVVTQFPFQFRITSGGYENNFLGGGPVVAPGASFSIHGQVADNDMYVSILWLERVAQPSELNL